MLVQIDALSYLEEFLLMSPLSNERLCYLLQNLWFANPGGSNSMPSQSRSSVQRTHSLPVHTSPQTMLMFQQQGMVWGQASVPPSCISVLVYILMHFVLWRNALPPLISCLHFPHKHFVQDALDF